MPERVIVGGNGLVGSAFCRLFDERALAYEVIQRENTNSHGIEACDLLVLSCGNANKGMAMRDPMWDFDQSVARVVPYVHQIRARTTILISTVDVYADPSSEEQTQEAGDLGLATSTSYGFHKWLLEENVKKYSENYLILRLPALVGPNLKKNPIFDFFEPEKPLFVSPESLLNVIHVDDVAQHALSLLASGAHRETFNVGATSSIKILDLAEIYGIKNDYAETAYDNVQTYNINVAKAARYVSLCSSETAIERYRLSLA